MSVGGQKQPRAWNSYFLQFHRNSMEINMYAFRFSVHCTSLLRTNYLTIRLRARVFYEEIVYEAQPS